MLSTSIGSDLTRATSRVAAGGAAEGGSASDVSTMTLARSTI